MSESEGEDDKRKGNGRGTKGEPTADSRVTLWREGPLMEWKKAPSVEPKRSAATEENERTKSKEKKEKEC